MSSGRFRARSPATVAWATLMLLDEPSDLARMSWMPAISRMARAAPPAMTPVPGRRRLEQHPAGAGLAEHRVGDGRTGQRHREQVLLGLLDALLDGQAGFLGLAVAEADGALAVADHHERGEGEPPAALDDLGDPVDLDGPVFVLLIGHVVQNSSPASRAASATAATRPWYRKPPRSNTTWLTPAALARSATSWPTAAAATLLPVAPGLAQVLLDRGGRGQRAPGPVVDDLGGDVLVAAEHRQAGPGRGAGHLLADPVSGGGSGRSACLGCSWSWD